jgi:hypothetical protein
LLLKKAEVAGFLERICQALELTDAQRQLAEARYKAVGVWLADADNPLLRNLTIYPQGSVSLSTTVKPRGRNEYDVDLVSFVPGLTDAFPPAALKRAIGDRLRANGHYAPILEEKPRCWRLNYANEFHLDITPSIRNPRCGAGGELVPDKQLAVWKPTNPKGYRALFERRASLQPRLLFRKALEEGRRAEMEPLPARMQVKGVLRRTVQLAKRHRDIYFERLDATLAPISVIITTLAARSYERCVLNGDYESELDLLRDILRLMPHFIEERTIGGRRQWFIWNESTDGENFAERWNAEPDRAEAFRRWHARVQTDLDRLVEIEGLDLLTKSLTESFGTRPVAEAAGSLTSDVTRARAAGLLSVAPGVGLSIGAGAGPLVRKNTFFGGSRG